MSEGKIVLITGGTGSFGSTFAKYLLNKPNIKMIRIFSRDEHKQRAMRNIIKSDRISYYIGDVRDAARLGRVMEGVDWVIHAAALKQAPVGEIEPQEFIKTNVAGSMNTVEAALDGNIEKALLISTDKAVEPINLYGATKMCAERMFLQADKMRNTKRTRFACTRYGNVAGTTGSVLPLFLSLLEDEPTPIHDPAATRFWITLPTAHEFVFNSIENMRGGEVFIPRMKSVRIMDIAHALRPGHAVSVLGKRPGDKRHEVVNINELTEERYSSDSNEFISIKEIRDYANNLFGHKVELGKSS